MKKGNVILEKSYLFALRIIEVYLHVTRVEKEFILSRQLVRAGVSMGANAEEANGAQSTRDFISKLSVSYKEARETRYILWLLNDSGLINKNLADSLIRDCEELIKILTAILNTTKNTTKTKQKV